MILHFHKKDETNLGDLLSNPFLYFDFPNVESYDIIEYKKTDPTGKHLVFGGGGMIGHRKMTPMMQEVINHPGKKSVTFWGAGHNFLGKDLENLYPDYLKNSNLIGIRDYIKEEDWVPCVSCMNTAFDTTYTTTTPYVIYCHKKVKMGFKKAPSPIMHNSETDFNKIINFLGSAETVITNSYHGAYWSLLLGKNVKLVNWNIKFDYFREPLDFIESVDDLTIRPFTKNDNIIEMYRDRNIKFAEKFRDLLDPLPHVGPTTT